MAIRCGYAWSLPSHLPMQSKPARLRKVMKVRATSSSSPPGNNLMAKEMERVAAKEALILAIKDAGGLDASAFGRQRDKTSIEVFEKLLALERLNPTPRPTTSPMLEGVWKFEWAGARSPAVLSSKFLLRTLPSVLLSATGFTLSIEDGTAKVTSSLKLFGTVETTFVLTTSISAEGPVQLREQYVGAVVATPKIPEGSVPSQLQGVYEQLLAAVERLPEALKESIASGLKLPLGGSFERLLLLSYLDEEMLVARDATGAPDVLSRLEMKKPVEPEIVT